LAAATVRGGLAEQIGQLVGLATTDAQQWRRQAMLEGMLAGRDKGPKGGPAPIRVARQPAGFEALASITDLGDLPAQVADALRWRASPACRRRSRSVR
ncbi:MAG: hypothetical protein O2816_08580, partial [Planctomycetota bacterium]|nr:hypothetical protein [Planctomycetota bacterium]